MFNQKSYIQLKSRLETDYKDYIQGLRAGLDEISKQELLSDYFIGEFNALIISPELNTFESENFYLVNLIEDLSFVLECLEDEDSESLLDFFSESNYANDFFEKIKDLDPLRASIDMLEILENQIISFYYLKISMKPIPKITYRTIPELGDSKRIYFQKNGSFFTNQNSVLSNFVTLKQEKSNTNKQERLNVSTLNLIPRDEFDEKVIQNQLTRIDQSIKVIQKHSPFCYEAFKHFSQKIVPINEDFIVSYSAQELPGYSCINMFNRDDVDLMDDLIHENGHHYLNAHLNITELIYEDEDKIFFSPWRDQDRPIRGLYHAYLTFYWAYKLFGDLSLAIISHDLELKPEQETKVFHRFIQEKTMLLRAKKELNKAIELNKISKEGIELIKSFEKEFNFEESKIKVIENYIK